MALARGNTAPRGKEVLIKQDLTVGEGNVSFIYHFLFYFYY